MSEFRVGKKYRMLADDHVGIPKGSLFTVLKIDNSGSAEETECGYFVARERLDDYQVIEEPFEKSDLKDGMRVELRNGNKRVVFNETTYCIEQGVAAKVGASLSQYRDDLTWIASFSGGYPDNDIIRVTDRDGTVLFEREAEPKKMSVADIERELGYPVEVVK